MKRISIYCLFLFFLVGRSIAINETDDPVKEERDALIARIESLKKIDTMPLEQSISYLGEGLRKMGDSSIYHLRDETMPVYTATQQKLLSIPGHAKYFADQVAAARSKSKDIVTDRNYHEACERLRDTLPHLPDPETVLVLGQMLESRADVPTLEQKLEVSRKQFRGGYFEWYCPSELGRDALVSLGIRDMPPPSDYFGQVPLYDVESLRGWWEEVKSGKRAFSFKGQSEEYRFMPDGTWETIAMVNPPDDGPKPKPSKPEAMRPEKSPPPSPPAPEPTAPLALASSASPSIYVWIIGCGILVLAAVAVFLKRRHAPK